MTQAQDTPGTHDPALARRHAQGTTPSSASPADRALAPEADAPLQSANAVADDGTYVGQGGGYIGASAPAAETGKARVNEADTLGAGTYGYPSGPGVGEPGGEHHPEGDAGVDAAPVPKR